jgi:CheY-like chemotaxis protein
VLPRIFDPFFTTKSTGSGLGLSSSYTIVSRHGGRITVQSTVGVGTVFEIHLPASTAPARAVAAASTVQGHGRILVMDDDDLLRSLFRRMLTRLGYECDLCAEGNDAVRQYDAALRAGRRYDAVILDLTIPGNRGGTYVLPLLKELDPDVVALVTSGYADDDVLAHCEQHGFRGRIPKPVDMASLSAELARVLR